jgi:hypothetical protein
MRSLPSLLLAILTPACVNLLDPLLPLDEDAGVGDAGDDSSDGSTGVELCEAGAEQSMPCGNCGTMTMTCLLGDWVYGECLGEGVCAWGSEETCASGDGTRMCYSNCTWGSCDDPLLDP